MAFINVILSHLLPAILVAWFVASVVIYAIGRPHCKHIFLMSNATDKEGIETFAKHLEKKSVSSECSSHDNWRCFIPAAKKMAKGHDQKLRQLEHVG